MHGRGRGSVMPGKPRLLGCDARPYGARLTVSRVACWDELRSCLKLVCVDPCMRVTLSFHTVWVGFARQLVE